MVIITVWHNRTSRFEEYSPNDRLTHAYKFSIPTLLGDQGREEMRERDVQVFLERCFEEFNIGEGLLAKGYRAAGNRSLSVGDLIEIETNGERKRYAVAHHGFKEVTK